MGFDGDGQQSSAFPISTRRPQVVLSNLLVASRAAGASVPFCKGISRENPRMIELAGWTLLLNNRPVPNPKTCNRVRSPPDSRPETIARPR